MISNAIILLVKGPMIQFVLDVQKPSHSDSFDLKKWQPKIIIVELVDDHPSFQEDKSFLKNNKQLRREILNAGYEEIYRDCINTIFKINKL